MARVPRASRRRSLVVVLFASFIAVLLSLTALLAVAFKLDGQSTQVASTPQAPSMAALTISHVTNGCHAFFINGQSTASATVQIAQGGTMTITNNDVMPHLLKLTSGPNPKVSAPNMNRPGAASTVKFNRPGTYSFITKAGEDYPSAAGIQTVGPDNQLKLTVVVS